MLHPRRRLCVALLVGLCGAVALASPAFAHVDPEPAEGQAGSQLSVGFTVGHGCAASPTVQLDMRLPDGVTSPVPEPPDGWTGSVDGNVVTFVGGPLPSDQALTFNVSMVLPPTPDTTIYFPFVQRCETGTIRWIDVPSDGSGEESDQPAPAMNLVGPVATTIATTTTTVAPTTVAPTTAAATTVAPTTATPSTAATSTQGPTSTRTATTVPATSAPAPSSVPVGIPTNSATGTAVFIGVVVAVIGAALALIFWTRRRQA